MHIKHFFIYSFFLFFFNFIINNTLYSQSEKNFSKESNKDQNIKDKALFYFIEGKTLELKNDFIGAVENYRTALKFDKSAGIYRALAEVYFKISKFDESLKEIKNALKIEPDNEEYLEIMANDYIALKEFKKAVDSYEKIISIDSNYTYGLYSLARLYQELNLPSKAIVIYEKITNKIGYDFDVLRKMYEIYYSYKDYGKSIEVLESLLKLDPYNTEIKKLLASLYQKNNETEKTKKLFEDILILNPDDKEVQTELVKIYFKENDPQKAFQNFTLLLGKDSLGYLEKVQIGELYYNTVSQDLSSLEIAKSIFTMLNTDFPEEWIPYYYLGAIEILEKNGNNYKEYFSKAIELADTNREVYINIGFTYYEQNDIENALSVTDEGLNKFPDDFRLNYIRGISLQRINREKDAIYFFEKAITLNPKDLNVLSTLALAYDNQGNYSKSEEMYERALDIDPRNALVLNNYAYNLSERGINLEKALSMSKISLEIDPENASYLDTVGWIYFKMKNYKEAKKNIERSLQINGNSAVVLEHLGDIYFAMNDYQNARKNWNLSLNLNPENKQLIEKLDNLK